MPKAKHGVSSRKRRKRTLEAAKGQQGSRSRLFRTAKESVRRALVFSYAHRKRKKGDFRSLWIARINAAVREEGISYSKFLSAIKRSGVLLNRKMLAQIALDDISGIKALVKNVK